MKAILEYNLPEDEEAHLRAVHALDWALVSLEMDTYLRGRIKYGELPEAVEAALQEARDWLREAQDSHGVSTEDIS